MSKKKLTQSIVVRDESGNSFIVKKGSLFEVLGKKTISKKSLPKKIQNILEKKGYHKFLEGLYSYNSSVIDEYMEDYLSVEDEFGFENDDEDYFEDEYYMENLDKIKEPDLVSNELPGVEDEADKIAIEEPTPDKLADPNLVSNDLPKMSVVDEKKKIRIPSTKEFDSFLK